MGHPRNYRQGTIGQQAVRIQPGGKEVGTVFKTHRREEVSETMQN
jgi:hypothetical protein